MNTTRDAALHLFVRLVFFIFYVLAFAVSGTAPAAANIAFTEIPGWQLAAEPVAYPPDKLWEVINGAAEQYLAYGVQELLTCDLAADDIQVTVNLYDMGSPLNAYGIYGTERSSHEDTVQNSTAVSLAPPYQALLLKDRYYVKVEAYQGKLTKDNSILLLSALASRLPGSTDIPREIQQLPSQGLIEGSATYTATGYLGLDELNRSVHAKYKLVQKIEEGTEPGKESEKAHAKDSEKDYEVFMIYPGPEESPTTIWQNLSGRWKRLENSAGPSLMREIPYRGIVGVFLTTEGIVGIAGAETAQEMMKVFAQLGVTPVKS